MPLPLITRANQSIEAQTPGSVEFSTGTSRALAYLGDSLHDVAVDIREKAKVKYAADIDTTIKKEVSRIERENLGKPEEMTKAFQSWHDGYVGQIQDKDMQAMAKNTFELSIISPINRAYGAKRVQMDNQATQSLLLQVEASQNSIADNIDDLFGGDEKIKQAAWTNIAKSSADIYRASSVLGADGVPLISGQAGANLVSDTKDKIMTGITLKWLSKQTNAQEALSQIEAGTVVFEATDGEKTYPINLMGSMSVSARKEVLNQAERYVSMQETMRKQSVSDAVSMASLGISRGQFGYKDLEKMKPQLDPEQYVRLSKELDSYNAKSVESANNFGVIASALAGDQPVIDLANPAMKQDINKYYDTVVMPALQTADPNTKINAMVDFVKKVGVVPQRMLGEMKSAFRTGTADTIRFYADALAQMKESAPQAFNDIPQQDIAFGEVVADLVNTGEKPEEAVKIAKELVNPANKAVVDNRGIALKERKRDDYLKETKGLFDSWIPFIGVKIDPNTPGGAAVVDDYKKQYDAYFKLTGNADVSRAHATNIVKGMYGVTEFNGKQVIAHPPEKYYGIHGLDNQNWMIQQLMDDVRKDGNIPGPAKMTNAPPAFETVQGAQGYMALKNIESAFKAITPQGDPLESRLFLASDNTTDRTAATGRPDYMVVYKADSGAMFPVLSKSGKPMRWAPVVERGKAKAVEAAKKAGQPNEMLEFQRKAQYGY
ncbi:MAG: hypothetical protein HGA87_05680 [Desulfobulbaceae bacterium]|nr:hypothetical protein [Desulfobulbaceae bacterium]